MSGKKPDLHFHRRSGFLPDKKMKMDLRHRRKSSTVYLTHPNGFSIIPQSPVLLPPKQTLLNIQGEKSMRLSKLSRSVEGKVVVITGAASGIGRATAHLFADQGAKVAAIDIHQERLDTVVNEMKTAGYEAKGWVLDLSNGEAVKPVIDGVADHFKQIDILVNNAGVSIFRPIDSDDYLSAWDTSLAVLLTAQMHMIRAALPYLRKAEHPRIINIASTEALGATKFGSPYTAGKTGIVGLTRSLAVELGKEAITVNCICPGPVKTGMTADLPDEHKQIYANRRVALKRYAEPEEIAHAILSLALPASQYITGVTLPVDGGLTIKNA